MVKVKEREETTGNNGVVTQLNGITLVQSKMPPLPAKAKREVKMAGNDRRPLVPAMATRVMVAKVGHKVVMVKVVTSVIPTKCTARMAGTMAGAATILTLTCEQIRHPMIADTVMPSVVYCTPV